MLHKFHRHLCFGTLAYSPHNWADPGDAGVKQVWHLSSAAAAAFELMPPLERRIRAATAGNVQLIT